MGELRVHAYGLIKVVIVLIIFGIGSKGHAQLYNKKYVARIDVKKDSEFYSFSATAENLTPTDIDLRYDFIVYKTDADNNTYKSNESNLFFIKGNEKVVLSITTVNFNEVGKITIVLILYDLEDKPVGQDRLELIDENGYQEVEHARLYPQQEVANGDQAAPQDGYVLDGLVLQNTLTKAGRDFHKYFYAEYFNLGIKTKKNIIIEEVPGKFRNTRISVKIDNQLVWQFFSQPKKSFLQSMAKTALNRCVAYLQELKQQNNNSITRY